MAFQILVHNDRKIVKLRVERLYLSDQIERYKVIGKDRFVVLQSNRPLLRKKGMKYRRPNWKLVEGQLHNISFLESLVSSLESYLKKEERSSHT